MDQYSASILQYNIVVREQNRIVTTQHVDSCKLFTVNVSACYYYECDMKKFIFDLSLTRISLISPIVNLNYVRFFCIKYIYFIMFGKSLAVQKDLAKLTYSTSSLRLSCIFLKLLVHVL